MSVGRFLQQGAAGNAGGATYVDDVFSTYLYTGNGSTQTITNGIDLSGEGGMVWIKSRDNSTFANSPNVITDTVTGLGNYLITNETTQQQSWSSDAPVATSSGFTLPVNSQVPYTNYLTGSDYVSWTFRKQPGFFDIVTWTGDGVAGRAINHSLGSTPGFMIAKRTDATGSWYAWHTSLNTSYGLLEQTSAFQTGGAQFVWGNSSTVTQPTSADFTAGASINASGGTYVAYLFAHDAQDFGKNSNESIIKCGSYTGNGSTTGPVIDLGFEPQWLLIKGVTSGSSYDWRIHDVMRGFTADGNGAKLEPNTSDVEDTAECRFRPLATGFQPTSDAGVVNASGATYIYVAIRRPHKPASEFAATDLFDDFKYKDNTLVQTDNPIQLTSQRQTGGPAVLTDMWWHALRGTTYPAGKSNSFFIGSRLQGHSTGMITNGTNAEPAGDASEMRGYDRMTGVEVGPAGTFYYNGTAAGNRDHISYYFRRAPGFFDVVAYTSVSGAINHNLGVIPEIIIYKPRSFGGWIVMTATDGYGQLDSTVAWGGAGNGSGLGPNLANATATTIHGAGGLYGNGVSMITYLFATVPGISKVGSYTGTGSAVDVDCGFTSGARFVLVKRTDSTGDWYVWDSARGIVAGNDGYLLLNSNAAEVTSTDYIDPLSSGFTITSTAPAALNASGGNYIFLAIA